MLLITRKRIYCFLTLLVIASLLCTKANALAGKDIYKMVSDSVYQVEVYNNVESQPISMGSAVAISSNTLVTNCHVVADSTKLYIVDNKNHYTVHLFKTLYDNDICLLRISGKKLKPVKMVEANFVEVGAQVYAIGSPLGISRSFSQGVISQKEFYKGAHYFFTDTSIAPGSSGGGLFDTNGNLIAVTTQTTRSKGNVGNPINIAVSVDMLIPYVKGDRFSELQDQKSTKALDNQSVHAPKQQVTEDIKYIYQTRTISKFGEYGDSNIMLLYDMYGCKIYIPGTTESGKTYGSVIAMPELFSDVVYILPYSGSIHESVNSANKLMVDTLNTKGKNLTVTAHTIRFVDLRNGVKHQKEYFLAESLKTYSDKDEYIGVFNFDIIDKFIRDNDFEVILREGSAGIKRSYGLWGFSEAMSHLNACTEKHTKVFGR